MKKVIDITDRVPAMKMQRRKRTNTKFILLTSIFVLIIGLLLYFQTSYSDIKTIDIAGAEIVDESFYLKQTTLNKNDSMWSFKIADVEKAIEANDWVKSVQVKREFINRVTVNVEEWQKVAYLSKDGIFYPMLENGVIFEKTSEMIPIDAPIFMKFDDEALRKKLLKELAKLDLKVLALISQINAVPTDSDPYAIKLFMNDGYEVRADINSLASRLNYYPSIIAQIESEEAYEKGIIDIEVGTYYRPFSDEYAIESLEEADEAEVEGVESDEEQSAQ